MIMIGINFKTIYLNSLLGLKNGRCFVIPANAKSCILVNCKRNIHIIWIISSLKKLLKRKIWVSWLVMILNSLTSVNQHAAKQWEFWELPTVLCNCVQNFRHDPDVMLRLYLIRPHLEYCTAAWSPHYCKEFKKIHSHDSRPQGSPIRTETCKNQIMVTRA